METEFALSLGTQRWPLPSSAEEITLGRAANADVRLPADDQISRIHARLVRTGAAWTLHDASRNGTGLNSRRLTAPTPLSNGDQIHIGRSVLTFHATPAAPPAATPAAPPSNTPAADPGAAPAAGTPAAPEAAPAASPHAAAPVAAPTPSPPAAAGAALPPPPGGAPTSREGGTPTTPPGAPAHEPPAADPNRRNEPAPADAASNQGNWQPASTSEDGRYGGAESDSRPSDGHDAGAASTTPPPPAPTRPLTPRPAPSKPTAAPSGPPADAVPRNDPYPADRASISQPNPADASNSASWPGYPSADYLESARSPLSGGDRAQIIQPDTPRTPYADRPDYPSYPDEPTPTRPAPRPAKRPERRPRETTDEVGQVRLARVFAIAGAMLAVGLVINLIATFLADGPGGLLRWLIAPTLALLGAMTFAILDAVSPTEREPGRLDVSVIVAIGAVLLGVGVGGFAVTSGAEYAAGYLSGNESGEDRLIKPVGKTTAGLTITIDNVTNTSHFTRIRVTVNNKGKDSVSLPLDGNATFTSAEGNSIRADASRSNWPDQFAAGQSEQGTIVFKGHLPQGQKTAILTLRPGDTPVVVTGIPLSN
ncbi:FHA domain-containing protein [Kribbella sp. NPDC056345]|uniref:FHA domain-containing protein n=1 Tax=Kribbella sp. NPDC056345 TaxID=3345789 RepID=UPI0035DFA008